MYVHVCTCVCMYVCVCMYTYLHTGQPVCNSSGAIYFLSFLLLGLALPETVPSSGLELTKLLTGLAGQETPGSFSLPAQLRDWQCTTPYPAFLCGFWESNSGPDTCKTSTTTKQVLSTSLPHTPVME